MNAVSFILKKATFNDLFVNSFIINEHSCLLLFRLVVARTLARRPRRKCLDVHLWSRDTSHDQKLKRKEIYVLVANFLCLCR